MIRIVIQAIAASFAATAALAAQGQARAQAPAASQIVAIGCITRAPGRAATASTPATRPSFLLTDTRSDPPTVYRLTGEGVDLDFHTGHLVEIKGTVTMARSGPHGLRIGSLVYIARTCPKTSGR